jgi:arylsulfatase A-like enzyme
MPSPSPGSVPRWPPLTLLAASIGFGLLAGLGELAVHHGRRLAGNVILPFGRDALWQVPLADAGMFLAVGLLLAVPLSLKAGSKGPAIAITVLGGLAALAVLLLVDRVHWGARLFLAAAIGTGAARVLAPRANGVGRLLRRVVPAAVLLLALVGALLPLEARLRSGRAVRALPAPAPSRPNVLLIILDTVRAWNLGIYGYARPTTPRLAVMAGQGAVFDRVLSTAPWTTPAHASLFTGRNPSELSVSWTAPLDGTHATVAEVLARAGYQTSAFVANYRYAGSSTGLARGFARYDDYPRDPIHALRSTSIGSRLLAREWVAERVGRRLLVGGRVGGEVTGAFVRWLDRERRAERPFFTFLNYFDAHAPYLAPAPFDSTYARGAAGAGERRAEYWRRMQRAFGPSPVPVDELSESLDGYDGAINYLDIQVDSVLQALAARRLLDNTLVIVTSDHGELFGEHGVIQHGNSMYLPVLHVPLFLRWPGRVPAGVRIQAPVSLRHVARTIVDAAGAEAAGIGGTSLTGFWGGGAMDRPPGDTLFAALDFNRRLPRFPPSPILRGAMASIVMDSLHYIRNGDDGEELYHLGRDSWEVRNLVRDSSYAQALAAHRSALAAVHPGSRP